MVQHEDTGEMTEQKQEAQCPVHGLWSWQKTAHVAEVGLPVIERDEQGVWHLHSFAAARAILRSNDTKQVGFKSEDVERAQHFMRAPILYLSGKEHHERRKMTARFFTPKFVSDHYRPFMERQADRIVQQLKRKKHGDLSQMCLTLTTSGVSQFIGLTNSLPGLAKRLDAFFDF